MAGSRGRSRRPSGPILGALGIFGSLTCSAAMTAAAFGIGGAAVGATGGMAAMSDAAGQATATGPIDAVVAFLVWAGPAILLLSLIAMGAATLTRRRAAAGLVLVAGVVLFWGMYLQPALSVMFGSIAAGLAALVVAYVWTGAGRAPARQP